MKIIQIQATRNTTGKPVLYALCEDGSLWELVQHVWFRIPPLPATTATTK